MTSSRTRFRLYETKVLGLSGRESCHQSHCTFKFQRFQVVIVVREIVMVKTLKLPGFHYDFSFIPTFTTLSKFNQVKKNKKNSSTLLLSLNCKFILCYMRNGVEKKLCNS